VPRDPVLVLDGVTKRFGGLAVTEDISFEIPAGARTALIGPNGAGKTTFVNLLTGVIPPSSGQILLQGEDITRLRPELRVQRGIARTFQINQLFPAMTPLETLGLAVSERMGGGRDWWRVIGSKRDIVDEIVEIAERFRLTDVLDERIEWMPAGASAPLVIDVTVDILPSGVGFAGSDALDGALVVFRTELAHLARRYETVVVNVAARGGHPNALASAVQQAVLCVCVGRTRLDTLATLVARLDAQGVAIRGLVLWEMAEPAPSAAGDASPLVTVNAAPQAALVR